MSSLRPRDALPVQGPESAGVAASTDPVQVAGVDADGKVRRLALGPAGTLASPNTALRTTAVAVGAAATRLDASPLANRCRVEIQNLGPDPIYVGGGATVTVATGRRVDAYGGALALDLGPAVALFAVCSAPQVSPDDTRVTELA